MRIVNTISLILGVILTILLKVATGIGDYVYDLSLRLDVATQSRAIDIVKGIPIFNNQILNQMNHGFSPCTAMLNIMTPVVQIMERSIVYIVPMIIVMGVVYME